MCYKKIYVLLMQRIFIVRILLVALIFIFVRTKDDLWLYILFSSVVLKKKKHLVVCAVSVSGRKKSRET